MPIGKQVDVVAEQDVSSNMMKQIQTKAPDQITKAEEKVPNPIVQASLDPQVDENDFPDPLVVESTINKDTNRDLAVQKVKAKATEDPDLHPLLQPKAAEKARIVAPLLQV